MIGKVAFSYQKHTALYNWSPCVYAFLNICFTHFLHAIHLQGTGCPVKHDRFFWYLVKSVTSKMSSVIELYYPDQKLRRRVPEKLQRLIVGIWPVSIFFSTEIKKNI